MNARKLIALLMLLTPAVGWTAPTGGAYTSDKPTVFVADDVAEAARALTTYLCIFAKAVPADMVNKAYLAMVGRACLADEVVLMSVTSNRASNDDPQISTGHVQLALAGSSERASMYFHLKAEKSPSAEAPNGVFTLNLSGVMDGTPVLRGRIAATAADVSMVLRARFSPPQGAGSVSMDQVFQLKLTYADGTRIEGVSRAEMSTSDGAQRQSTTMRFAEGADYYCRVSNRVMQVNGAATEGSSTNCYDRSREQAIPLSVVYGLYDDQGERFTPPGAGLAIMDEWGEVGVASYRAVFPARIANDSRVHAVTSGVYYTVVRAAGSLHRVTRKPRAIDTLAGNVFEMNLARPLNEGLFYDNVRMTWNAATRAFEVVQRYVCVTENDGSVTCGFEPLAVAEIVPPQELATFIQSGTRIIASGENDMFLIDFIDPAVPVVLREEVSAVDRADASAPVPAWLQCVTNCPDVDAMAKETDASNIYVPGTFMEMPDMPSPVYYQWNAAKRELNDASARSVAVPADAPWAVNGASIETVWLVEPQAFGAAKDACISKFGAANCATPTVLDMLDVSYRWYMPMDPDLRPAFLRSGDGSFNDFAIPEYVSFQVPNEPTYGTFANTQLRVLLDPQAGLRDLPSRCIDPQTGDDVPACDTMDFRAVPAIVIGDQGFVTRDDGSKLWVRPLDREVLLRPVAAVESALGRLPPASVQLPDLVEGDDPSDPKSDVYAGEPPAAAYFVETVPTVVDGVRQ